MSFNSKEEKIFDDTKVSDIMKKIYELVEEDGTLLKDTINTLIDNLHKDSDSSLFLAPVIKDFLDVSVKNNDLLIKLMGVVQKFITGEKEEGKDNEIFNDEERARLLLEIQNETKQLYDDAINIKEDIHSKIGIENEK